MLLADRPTTSRWTPLCRANAPIRSGRSSKARTEADTSSARHPSPGSQIAFESDLGSAFDPTRTVARAGTKFNTGIAIESDLGSAFEPNAAFAAQTAQFNTEIAIRWRQPSGADAVNRRSDRQRRSALALPSVAKRKLAPAPSECWIVAKGLVRRDTAREEKQSWEQLSAVSPRPRDCGGRNPSMS